MLQDIDLNEIPNLNELENPLDDNSSDQKPSEFIRIKEIHKHIQDLEKENFNLKIRVHLNSLSLDENQKLDQIANLNLQVEQLRLEMGLLEKDHVTALEALQERENQVQELVEQNEIILTRLEASDLNSNQTLAKDSSKEQELEKENQELKSLLTELSNAYQDLETNYKELLDLYNSRISNIEPIQRVENEDLENLKEENEQLKLELEQYFENYQQLKQENEQIQIQKLELENELTSKTKILETTAQEFQYALKSTTDEMEYLKSKIEQQDHALRTFSSSSSTPSLAFISTQTDNFEYSSKSSQTLLQSVSNSTQSIQHNSFRDNYTQTNLIPVPEPIQEEHLQRSTENEERIKQRYLAELKDRNLVLVSIYNRLLKLINDPANLNEKVRGTDDLKYVIPKKLLLVEKRINDLSSLLTEFKEARDREQNSFESRIQEILKEKRYYWSNYRALEHHNTELQRKIGNYKQLQFLSQEGKIFQSQYIKAVSEGEATKKRLEKLIRYSISNLEVCFVMI